MDERINEFNFLNFLKVTEAALFQQFVSELSVVHLATSHMPM